MLWYKAPQGTVPWTHPNVSSLCLIYIRKLRWFKIRRWRFLIYVGQTDSSNNTRYTNRYIPKLAEYVLM